MAATSLLESFEVAPNTGIKSILLMTPNTADENNTFTITLTDYGISATGLLGIVSRVHTTDGSVIVDDIATTSVAAGVLTITVQSANTNAPRVIEIFGKSTPGVFV